MRHYFGNAAFDGATFISSEMCRKMVLETGHEWLGIMERDVGRKLTGTRPIAADISFALGTKTENWIGTLDEMRDLGMVHFVPGHGDLMTIRDVTSLRDALHRFYSDVKQAYRDGRNESEIRESLDLSTWRNLERPYVIGRTSTGPTWRSRPKASTSSTVA